MNSARPEFDTGSNKSQVWGLPNPCYRIWDTISWGRGGEVKTELEDYYKLVMLIMREKILSTNSSKRSV